MAVTFEETRASGYGNTETMEQRGNCSNDTGAAGVVLARDVDGRLLAHAANRAGSPGGVVQERAADLCRCDSAHKAVFVEELPFVDVESKS